MSGYQPRWIACPFCGERRDTSSKYTSPAEQARITQWWKSEHLSGACTNDLDHGERP